MKNKKKRTLSRIILEKIAESGEVTLDSIFPRTRADTRIWRNLLDLDDNYTFSPRTFSSTIHQLKKQGLVARSGSTRKARWDLTRQGKDTLAAESIEPPKEDGVPRLVMFDIPETERGKRDRLRIELVACGYKQLQLSVWLGYCPLPEEFLNKLDELRLKGKVHIVSIKHSGTIEDIF